MVSDLYLRRQPGPFNHRQKIVFSVYINNAMPTYLLLVLENNLAFFSLQNYFHKNPSTGYCKVRKKTYLNDIHNVLIAHVVYTRPQNVIVTKSSGFAYTIIA